MLRTRLAAALVPAAVLLSGALATAPSASAAQFNLPQTGFNQEAAQGFSLGSHGGSGASGAATIAQSTNWSGYAVTGSTYTSVQSTWTQPTLSCTSQTSGSYAAFWDGLDGYSSSTVEQTGTLGECVGRTAEYSAWYETYPNPMRNFGGVVKPGDSLTATVQVVAGSGNKSFKITLTDNTQGWSAPTTQTLSRAPALSSAEFIAEAPSSGNRILPLAPFGSVTFTSPFVNTTALSPTTSGLTPIEMVAQTSRRSVTVEALPGPVQANGSFTITQ